MLAGAYWGRRVVTIEGSRQPRKGRRQGFRRARNRPAARTAAAAVAAAARGSRRRNSVSGVTVAALRTAPNPAFRAGRWVHAFVHGRGGAPFARSGLLGERDDLAGSAGRKPASDREMVTQSSAPRTRSTAHGLCTANLSGGLLTAAPSARRAGAGPRPLRPVSPPASVRPAVPAAATAGHRPGPPPGDRCTMCRWLARRGLAPRLRRGRFRARLR